MARCNASCVKLLTHYFWHMTLRHCNLEFRPFKKNGINLNCPNWRPDGWKSIQMTKFYLEKQEEIIQWPRVDRLEKGTIRPNELLMWLFTCWCFVVVVVVAVDVRHSDMLPWHRPAGCSYYFLSHRSMRTSCARLCDFFLALIQSLLLLSCDTTLSFETKSKISRNKEKHRCAVFSISHHNTCVDAQLYGVCGHLIISRKKNARSSELIAITNCK